MEVVYVGPRPEGVDVGLPSGDAVHAPKGEAVDFRPDVAEGLLIQNDIWKRPGDVEKTPSPPKPSKAVRKLAEELNVNLEALEGTGKNDNILVTDVKAAAEAQANTQPDEETIAPDAGESTEPSEGPTEEDE